MGKIFISHSSANNAEALAIHDWLAAAGWDDVFLDLDPRRGLVAGDRWQAALKAAADRCQLILLLISPEWARSQWCLAEFLLAKQMNKQILAVLVRPTPLASLPIELTAEWQLVDLSAPDTAWSTTISPPRFTPETTIGFSGTGLARLHAGLEKAGLDPEAFAWPPPSDPQRTPYRGLLPLDADDAGIFFGRDGMIVLTLDALRGLRTGAAPRFATILGASGSGKSSFLRAGLLPRLARDSRRFEVLPPIRPERAALTGEHGFAAMLDTALRQRDRPRNRAEVREAVAAGAAAVRPLLRQLVELDAGDSRDSEPPVLVVVVDQAEELLAAADNPEAGALLALLAELGATDDPALLVIFAVRSDSFQQLQSRAELRATQPHHLVDLPPVPSGAYGDIIRGPARRLNAAGRKLLVEETLVDALLGDIEQGGTKDALPLLAFTLERLFTEYGADGDLQLDEYTRLGRIRGAIEAAVEEALRRADADPAIPRDRTARLALLRRGLIPWLAGLDPETGRPRRRVARLAEVPAEARPLIDLMVEQRLLATHRDEATGEITIEPAHEALLRQWGALDGWLVEDGADLGVLESLRRAATDWAANAEAAEYLVHAGARLATAVQIAANPRFADYLTSVDRGYLDAAAAAEAAARRRAGAARRRLAIAGAVAAIVLVVGLTAGWFVWSAGETAKRQAAANFDIARSEAALRAGRSEDAAAAALAAYALVPDATTRTAALTATMNISPYSLGLIPTAGRVVDMAFVDPAHLLVLFAGGTLRTLDLGTRRLGPAVALTTASAPIALTPQGDRVVLADASIATLDGKPVAAAPAGDFAPRAGTVSTSTDGRVLGFVGLIGDVLVRDCRAASCTDRHLDIDDARAVAIKPDGTGFAVEGLQLAIYDDLAGPPTVTTNDLLVAAAWSPDSKLLLASQFAGTSRYLIDPADPTNTDFNLLPSRGKDIGTDSLANLAWSPAGDRIAVQCGAEGTICIAPRPFTRSTGWLLAGHPNHVGVIRWSPDGTRLALSSDDGNIQLWSASPDNRITALRRGDSWGLTTVATDPRHGIIAAGGMDGGIAVWTGQQPPVTLEAPDPALQVPVSSLAFLGDGRLAAVYQSRGVVVWSLDRKTPDKIVKLDNLAFTRIAAVNGDVRAAVPLSDRTILTLSGDDLRDARVPADTVPRDQWGLTGAPQANTVFVSYSDGSIRRRDLAAGGDGTTIFDAGKPVCGASATTDNNGALSLDVTGDGRWLTATRTDAHIIVHDLADPARPLCLSPLGTDSKTVAFSPDGGRLAVLSATDRLSVFDLARPDAPLILDAPAVPGEPRRFGRDTSWLAWQNDHTLAISTIGSEVESIDLDPAVWQARVDSLVFTQ